MDWTVGIGLDEEGYVCEFWRWKGLPWRAQVQRIRVITGTLPAYVDSTGVGDPVVEYLQAIGPGGYVENTNFEGYHFSRQKKQILIEGLINAIQGQEIHFPPGPIVSELESYEYEYLPTGVVYAAAEGMKDDCVAALALAVKRWRETTIQGGGQYMYTARSLGLEDEDD
jgi:hypothetical protein